MSGDDASGVSAAVEHLVDLGHRDILHLAGPPNLSTSSKRAVAFTAACARHSEVRGKIIEAESLTTWLARAR